VAAAGTASWAQDKAKGTIEGTVVNELGKPVSKAKVHAELTHSRPQASVYRIEETDENGQFFIDQLDWSEYIVGANEKRGRISLPTKQALFYGRSSTRHLEATGAHSKSTDPIYLESRRPHPTCYRQGHEGSIASNIPPSPQTRFDDCGELPTAHSDSYRILIPQDTPIFLEASADGYKTWYFGGSAESSRSSPLRLESRQTMTLHITVEPAPSQKRVTRISQGDGLDRLASVCEVTSSSQLGSGGTPAAPGWGMARHLSEAFIDARVDDAVKYQLAYEESK
jgi:hypothetical protein